MDYTKQLIKAINDLTKAVNKNTEAIRDDKGFSIQRASDDLGEADPSIFKNFQSTSKVLTPDEVAQLVNKGGVFVSDVIYSGSWDSPKGIERINTKDIPFLDYNRTGTTFDISHSGNCTEKCGCDEQRKARRDSKE